MRDACNRWSLHKNQDDENTTENDKREREEGGSERAAAVIVGVTEERVTLQQPHLYNVLTPVSMLITLQRSAYSFARCTLCFRQNSRRRLCDSGVAVLLPVVFVYI